jgi:hypothetical protein
VYRQPVGSPALSAALAALPLVVLLVLLGIVRMKSHWAGLIGLATAVLIAVAVYGMPLGQAADGATPRRTRRVLHTRLAPIDVGVVLDGARELTRARTLPGAPVLASDSNVPCRSSPRTAAAHSLLYPLILLLSFVGAYAIENRMWGV